jgi:copper chaperone CopZ
MERVTLDVPAMYADHHVLAVREALSALPGVADAYASAAFQQVVVTYDPGRVSREQIEMALAECGYGLGQPAPVPAWQFGVDHRPHYTTAPTVTEGVVRFSVEMSSANGGTLPCPGFEPRELQGEHPADRV